MSTGDPHEHAAVLEGIGRILAGTDTERAVADALRALPSLDDAGRGRVARRITSVTVRRIALAHRIGADARTVSAQELLDAERAPERAPPADAIEALVVEESCPRPLVDALVRSLGREGARAFLHASNTPGPKTLRTNTLVATRDALSVRLAGEGIRTHAGALTPWSLHVEGRANLFGSPAWRAGAFEVQDEGSQLVALACEPKRGDVVVDLCAGRGGKTLALAMLMQNEGTLHVHDVDERALADMAPRLARAHVTCVVRSLPGDASADVVLVDAPCSSTGVLRRSPDLRYRFTAASASAHVDTQRALLAQAARLVKPRGRVVYATCSVLDEENRGVVESVSGLVVDSTRTLLPHVEDCDGFFIAVLTRT